MRRIVLQIQFCQGYLLISSFDLLFIEWQPFLHSSCWDINFECLLFKWNFLKYIIGVTKSKELCKVEDGLMRRVGFECEENLRVLF